MDLVIKRREASEVIEMNKKVRVMKGSGETERINGGNRSRRHTQTHTVFGVSKKR